MSPQNPKLSAQILEEASDWFVEFSEGMVDAAAREQFDAWVRRSPEHVQAYLKITALWEEAPLIANGRTLDPNELFARARAAINVVALNPYTPLPAQSTTESQHQDESACKPPGPQHAMAVSTEAIRPTSFSAVRFIAVAASLIVVVAGLWFYAQRDTYSTDFGEQRSVRLDDGSIVDLNSKSKIRVRFSEHQRNVLLLEGQGLFSVAKDTSRPFVVATTDTHVRAVGTQFDVYRKDSGTVVTVLEGRVAVLSGLAASARASSAATAPSERVEGGPARDVRRSALTEAIAQRRGLQTSSPSASAFSSSPATELLPAALAPRAGEILIAAGEQVLVSPRIASQPQPADLVAATAWTRHKIVFHGTPLTEVAEEFNRYNARQIVVSDADLISIKISGVFSSTDAESLLRFLRALPDITIDETGSSIRILRK